MSYHRFARNMPNAVEEIFVLLNLLCAIFVVGGYKQILNETPFQFAACPIVVDERFGA